jgi:gluconolactonase
VILCEVAAGRLARAWADGRKTTVAEVGGGPNGAAIGPDGAVYVCNNGGIRARTTPSIQRVDIDTGEVTVLYTACDGQPLVGPNDLVFDETGSFWFTDHIGDAIYYAEPDGSRITKAIDRARSANGVGLSPDGRTLYWAQTASRQVMRRRLTAPGELVPSPGYSVYGLVMNKAIDPGVLLVGLPGARELDSLAVDSSGTICVGTLLESGISVISADGRSVELLTLPEAFADRIVTNICFGGADLTTAFITCAETGRLVACDWPRPGLKLAFNR